MVERSFIQTANIKKIKDDKTYLVWARIHDAADPEDFSTTTRVIYVEEL